MIYTTSKGSVLNSMFPAFMSYLLTSLLAFYCMIWISEIWFMFVLKSLFTFNQVGRNILACSCIHIDMLHFIHFALIKVELLSSFFGKNCLWVCYGWKQSWKTAQNLLSSLSLSRPSGVETTVMLNGEFLFGVGTTEIKTISQI